VGILRQTEVLRSSDSVIALAFAATIAAFSLSATAATASEHKDPAHAHEPAGPQSAAKKSHGAEKPHSKTSAHDSHSKGHDSHATPVAQHDHAPAHKAGLSSFISKTLGTLTGPFLKKVDDLRRVDERNEELSKRVAKMEIENAALRSKLSKTKQQKVADRQKRLAKRESGVPFARTIASLKPKEAVLSQKSAADVYALGFRAYDEQDYDLSAQAFLHLLSSPEATDYVTSESHFFAAASLFRLHNYQKALFHFEQSQKLAVGEELEFAPRSAAWIAVCQKRLGRVPAAQSAVKALIEKFPQSKEALRLNRYD
jgi:hypothetical protein